MEDGAVLRGGALAEDNERRILLGSGNIVPEEQECDGLNEVFAEWEKRERRMDQRADEIEMRKIRNIREKKEGKSSFSRGGRQAKGPDARDLQMKLRPALPKQQPHIRPELMLFGDIYRPD
ncbi:unnamed protein product [Tuber aestivum]|uniref:Uncharacterized protein n=1 Tax=Tuber aestivum TaxID=59557 RepID=A0A292PXJ9_9PEZI|nr:unnamed protein product [Tuber aestivum]